MIPLCLLEQPGEELRREQREAAAEDDAADLPLGAPFTEHEHEAAEDDGDEREGAGERSCEGSLEVGGGALPRGLRGCGQRPCGQDDEHGCGTGAEWGLTWVECCEHVVPPGWRVCVRARVLGTVCGSVLWCRRGRGQCWGVDGPTHQGRRHVSRGVIPVVPCELWTLRS